MSLILCKIDLSESSTAPYIPASLPNVPEYISHAKHKHLSKANSWSDGLNESGAVAEN